MIKIKGFTFMSWSRPRYVKINAVFQGLAWSLGISLSVCFALGLWAMLSVARSYYFPPLLSSGALFGVLAGGLAAGGAAKISGWLHGGLVGFCSGLLFLFLVFLGGQEIFNGFDLAGRLGLYTICGLLGGVIGVNLSAPTLKKRFFALRKRFPGQPAR